MTAKADADARPLFVMLGGFLGAGKTTSVLRIAAHLQSRGKRVGIITNDQADGLVDTALAREVDLPVREIAGGCFCCKSERLVEALERLETANHPDVFVAEPVGSCTDLMATVQIPLQRVYRKEFRYAPYSVLVDPFRAMQTLCVGYDEAIFSPDIQYIYRKQLEEAEILVVNKIDVLSQERLATLRDALRRDYPDTRVIEVASREGAGLEYWFDLLSEEESDPKRLIEVDYARYGRGEALLGWYNANALLRPKEAEIDGNQWLRSVVERIQNELQRKGVEIAHLKGALSLSEGLASMHVTCTVDMPVCTQRLRGPIGAGGAELILNLRAEGDPEILKRVVDAALLHDKSVLIEVRRVEAFRPGQPTPIHRATSLDK